MSSPTQWETELLDLAAYLRRIGCSDLLAEGVGSTASTELLWQVHRAHSAAIPFENLDILLGRGIQLDLESVQDKLVTQGRGGYCHEQNLLLAAALERLGFSVTRLTARMLVGSRHPATHIALRVLIEGAEYLADVGLGAEGLIDPVPLREGEYADADGWLHSLTRHCATSGWELSVRRPGGKAHMLYRIVDEPTQPIDFEVSTHWTSTHPRSPFTSHLVVHQRKPHHRLALSWSALVEMLADRDVVTDIDRARLSHIIAETFQLPLSADELASLRS